MIFFYFILTASFLFTQNFNIDQNYGTIIIDEKIYDKPFLGGFNKPKIQWLDWDNDNDDDLFLLDENGSIKLFINNSVEGEVEFDLFDTNFLNLKGISWFFIGDFDNDNSYEIITQDINDINQSIYYDVQNNVLIEIGTLYDNQMAPIESDPVMFPTFIDIDNDGDLDFFTGNLIGTITFYENIGFSVDRPQFDLVTTFWEELYIVGPSSQRHGASAINFIDIDNDLDYDLAWGDFFQQSLYIIINIGDSQNPNMDNINIINQYPSNSPVLSAGLNMPSFTDIDNDSDKDLFVTVLSGAYGYQLINNFYYYNYENGQYNLQTQEFIQTLDLFSDIYPDLVDIDSDGDLDLFVGTASDLSEFPISGKIKFYENIGNDLDGEPIWNLVDDDFLGSNLGYNLSLDFGDIDLDGDYDIVLGDYNGIVNLYLNNGNENQPFFEFHEQIEQIDLSGYTIPKLVDIDLDLDLDLFIGQSTGNISFYENIGTNQVYEFIFITDNYQNIQANFRSSLEFLDLDNDQDLDLILGTQYDNIIYYENIGDGYNANFLINSNVAFPDLGLNLIPTSFNINNNNKLLVGTSTGGAFLIDLSICSISGDYNNDLIVNIIDIIYLLNVILNSTNEFNICPFDLNNDSIIDILDILILVNIIVL
tara:strand:+ start:1613 stop:3553 length:1941 start_codon:yes stop_codon:yes gene_type:complete